jgi:hypothetical protein
VANIRPYNGRHAKDLRVPYYGTLNGLRLPPDAPEKEDDHVIAADILHRLPRHRGGQQAADACAAVYGAPVPTRDGSAQSADRARCAEAALARASSDRCSVRPCHGKGGFPLIVEFKDSVQESI